MNLPPIRDLKLTLQPDPKKEKVWYAKYVIRKISIYLTWILIHTPITANQTTIIQAVLGIAGSVLLAFGGRNWAILALVIIQLGYIFDCVDGEIARYRKKPTINGIFLDALNHAVVIPIIFIGLAIYSYHLNGQLWILFIGTLLGLISSDSVKKGMLSALFYMLERKDNPKYQYSTLQAEVGMNQTPAISQEITPLIKKSIGQIIYVAIKDISEYPTSLNVITLFILVDYLIFKFTTWKIYPLPVILTFFYTIFLLGKEGIFFYKIYTKKTIEKKFLEIIKE